MKKAYQVRLRNRPPSCDGCPERGIGRTKSLIKQADRDKVHVGNAVLKASGHKAGDGEDDRQDLVGRGPRRRAQPHRQAHQALHMMPRKMAGKNRGCIMASGDVQGREADCACAKVNCLVERT